MIIRQSRMTVPVDTTCSIVLHHLQISSRLRARRHDVQLKTTVCVIKSRLAAKGHCLSHASDQFALTPGCQDAGHNFVVCLVRMSSASKDNPVVLTVLGAMGISGWPSRHPLWSNPFDMPHL
ncbi:hypothetical protein BASA62_003630 [Batrachochytrium salamandrivorans]|nr:hypothetical protein BASA62_003630 [Batrachochytrium salamandrivorans]